MISLQMKQQIKGRVYGEYYGRLEERTFLNVSRTHTQSVKSPSEIIQIDGIT